MRKVVFMAILATGIAMSGCKKEKEEKLEIHVHSPESGKSYASPVTVDVHIEGGELTIHDVEIKIFEKANVSNVVFDYDNHVEVTSFEVNDVFNATVTSPTVFTLQANVGEDEHTATLTHDFTIHP
jgi:hypothetical protein